MQLAHSFRRVLVTISDPMPDSLTAYIVLFEKPHQSPSPLPLPAAPPPMAPSEERKRKKKRKHQESEENDVEQKNHHQQQQEEEEESEDREVRVEQKVKKRKKKKKEKKSGEEEEVEGNCDDVAVVGVDDARGHKRNRNPKRKEGLVEESAVGSGGGDVLLELSKSDEEFFNALASDTSTSSSDDDEKDSKSLKRQGLLHWMRKPSEIDIFKECPINQLPCLDPRLEDALQKMGYQSLFPVQLAVWQTTIGPGGSERDICVNSPTGSGKTLAYVLPIVQMLSTRKIRCLRALVVVPTRDLAMQVKQVFDAVAPAVGLHVGLAVGQSSIEKEISDLIKRPNFEMGMPFDPEDLQINLQSYVDILVATPGRLVDHINTTRGFSLEHLQYLVVDEVDRLVSEGYQSWLPTVLQLACSGKPRLFKQATIFNSLRTIRRRGVERGFKDNMYPRLVKMIFSATLTKDPSKLDQLDLHHAMYLTSGDRRYSLPEKLESYRLICNTKLKFLYLAALLQDLRAEKSIIFTSSIELTHRLSTSLSLLGCLPIKISEYSRLQKQSVRSNTLKDFRQGRIQVLVCSDAMTRGMDVEGIKNVINYDMPPYIKKYIHRAGRTARAGQAGRCFTFLRKHEVKSFMNMLQKVGIDYCSDYKLPSESLERLQPICATAMEKLIELVESNSSKC